MAIAILDDAVTPRRFTVEEYYRMAEAGILGPEERVELLDGVIYVMSPIGSRHASNVHRLGFLLGRLLGDRAQIRFQSPIRLTDDSEPEPDLAIVMPHDDFYESAHPQPADIFWLVEAMETSAAYDRGRKLRSYARAGIVEVWLVDLKRETVEVYRQPEGDEYTDRRVLRRGQSVSCLAFPDLELAVIDILG
jgi:Uma2 family endonuclease